MISIKGILHFAPEDRTKKHKNQSSWKKTALIRTNCDISEYYSWFLKKRFSLDLVKTLRGSHVTIISDKMDSDMFEEAMRVFDKKEITFYYNPEDIRTSGKHWWIKVSCPEAESIREAIGLDRDPYFGFHLTLGYAATERSIEHSQYILECIKKFNL